MDVQLKIASKQDINITALVNMINAVYRNAEDEIWQKEHLRISNDRLTEIIGKQELLIAVINDEIAGCIHLEPVNKLLYKFKMLAANPKYKGIGIGSKLVKFAEETAINYGADTMQLELLVPTDFIHEDKVFLNNWYSKIGYIKKSTHSVDYCHDGISQFLKVDCEAIVYQKPLIL
ncbi:MAG: GNAT family N-acetyltransferase [Vicingaceae bacterium]|nr:GNAT family N-acetyltransferase [Vicingaceae bacterium]